MSLAKQAIKISPEEKKRRCQNPRHYINKEKLIRSHIPMALNLASKYFSKGIDKDEIVSQAMLGLSKAIKTYDPKQSSFTTYAYWAVLRSIQAFIRDEYKKKPTITSDILVGALERQRNYPSPDFFLEDIKYLLTPRQLQIIKMRFGYDEYHEHTLLEIAQKFGFCKERTRQILEQAFERIRSNCDV